MKTLTKPANGASMPEVLDTLHKLTRWFRVDEPDELPEEETEAALEEAYAILGIEEPAELDS